MRAHHVLSTMGENIIFVVLIRTSSADSAKLITVLSTPAIYLDFFMNKHNLQFAFFPSSFALVLAPDPDPAPDRTKSM